MTNYYDNCAVCEHPERAHYDSVVARTIVCSKCILDIPLYHKEWDRRRDAAAHKFKLKEFPYLALDKILD